MVNPFGVAQALTTLLQARDARELRDVLRARPELLSSEIDVVPLAEAMLESQARFAEPGELEQMRKQVALLERCRSIGLDAAFAELGLAEDPQRPLGFLEALALLSPEVRHGIQTLLREAGTPQAFLAALRERPELREPLERAMRAELDEDDAEDAGPPAPQAAAIRERMRELAPQQRELLDDLMRRADGPEAFVASLQEHPELAQALGVPAEVATTSAQLSRLMRAVTSASQRLESGEPEALDELIDAWGELIRHPGFGAATPEFRHLALNDASTAYSLRFRSSGRLEDVDQALALGRRALDEIEADPHRRAMGLGNVAQGLKQRHELAGGIEDLREAAALGREALALAGEDARLGPGLRSNLGNCLLALHEAGEPEERVAEAIELYEQALRMVPEHDLERATRYRLNLVAALSSRFDRSVDARHLEQAIELAEECVEPLPVDAEMGPMARNNLATLLHKRFRLAGRIEDLETGLTLLSEVVQGTHPRSPSTPLFSGNLARGLLDRYRLTGEAQDLDRAIEVLRAASGPAFARAVERPACLRYLVQGLIERGQRSGARGDLFEAARAGREALKLTPPDAPGRPNALAALGRALGALFEATGRVAELDQALEAFEEARATAPEATRVQHVYQLGLGHAQRFQESQQRADLDEAIERLGDAVDGLPSSSPLRADALHNLGYSLLLRHELSGQRADLERAAGSCEQAVTDLEQRFASAPVLYGLHQQGSYTASYAAAVQSLCLLGQPERALTIAEGCKSRLLMAQLVRGELPAPAGVSPEEARRERELAAEVAALDALELAQHDLGGDDARRTRSARVQQRASLLEELDRLWQELASRGPECAQFVELRRGRRPRWEAYRRLAEELGPRTALLSLFCLSERTFLFVLRQGLPRPVAIELPLEDEGWRTAARGFASAILAWEGEGPDDPAWSEDLRGLFDAARPHLGDARRIVLAPDTYGHLLPWGVIARHAGCELPVSTVPTLGLLPRLLAPRPGGGGEVLVVGNPTGDLPFAEEEARQVAAILGAEPLLGPQATKQAVLARLGDADIGHFATHGLVSDASPLDSGLLLADGALTAREILASGLRVPPFVGLSGCYTGVVRPLGGEELAGLSQSFFLAGARTLLAGLWAVSDSSTARLMHGFYSSWRGEGLGKAESLHRSMLAMQAGEPRWTHPHHWGAFGLIGDGR